MPANIGPLILFALSAFILIWVFTSKPKVKSASPNTLISHRKKRVGHFSVRQALPDVATAHEHENKLKQKVEVEIPEEFKNLSLINSLDDDARKKLKQDLRTIRKPHPLLEQLTRNIVDPKKLYEIIRTDPELVAKIINVSNSPLFALSTPITNVNHAVIYLGVMQVKNVATHFALQESEGFEFQEQKVAYERIWSAGFLASSIAQLLAQELSFDNAAELATRCQLSYLGDISLLFTQPECAYLYLESSSLIQRIKSAQSRMDVDIGTLAQLVAQQWNLPSQISAALGKNLLPLTHELDLSDIDQVVHQEILLCYLCCRLADAFSFDQDIGLLKTPHLSFEQTGRVEFLHLQEQIQEANFDALNRVYANPVTKNKINALLGNLENTSLN